VILLIDNYDSFTYNIYQELSALGADVTVRRNDAVTVDEVRDSAPAGVVVSPGPGEPSEAGVSTKLMSSLERTPVLGVCLGHQCIGAAYGGKVVHAAQLMLGKTSLVYHA
jgi:anthranilate synthase/aminodeoxychorismate synthase-like glutamine amidotransferase